MANVKVFFDKTGNTLTVWFNNPNTEYICEETEDEVVLMKDKTGSVIGFERLNFIAGAGQNEGVQVDFETIESA